MWINFFKGLLIGVANIIPGVSGGTFAFVLGILDRILKALNSIQPLKLLIFLHPKKWFTLSGREELGQEFQRMDAKFLIVLGLGVITSILLSAHLIEGALISYPHYTLALFIGLILPSLGVPLSQVPSKKPIYLIPLLLGILVTVGVSNLFLSQSTAEPSYFLIFLGGIIAFIAMILPGISGSFMLLVMGLYAPAVFHIKSLTFFNQGISVWLQALPSHLLWLGTLALGLVVGAKFSAKIISYFLQTFRSATLIFLVGMLLGSFWVLWPIKDIEKGKDILGRDGKVKYDVKIMTAPNRLPSFPQDSSRTLFCALFILLGSLGGVGVNRLGKSGQESPSLEVLEKEQPKR
jgi:putative membrane protein